MKRLFSRLTAGLLTAIFLFSQNIALAQGLTELTLSESEKISTFKEPEIIEEIISKREECVKHFRKSDLSCVAVLYSEPVHYKDEHGNFQEIDNSLLEENGEFTNTGNLFKVKLSKNSDDKKLVTVTSNGNEISWSYIKKNRKLRKDILPDSEKILDNSTETKIVSDESAIQKNSAEENKPIASEEELAKQWAQEIASKYQPETAQIENFKVKDKKLQLKKKNLQMFQKQLPRQI